ncbi:MAG TPA: uroporphyrinogen-III synthase [Verrucomicrobiae bacterium]|nr:uroporphyrinogen-III synthase [Verrucomicrobiae bacterium]
MLKPKIKTVVLTRDTASNTAWGKRLEALGFHVYSLPTIETGPLNLDDQQKDILRHLSDFDWLVFTSAKSVRYFIGVLFQLGIQWPSDKPQVAAIGNQTALLIKERGMHVGFKPSQANSAALGNELTPINGMRILFPRSGIAPGDLARLLSKRGGDVISLPIYTTRLIEEPDEAFLKKLSASSIDYLIFASPSAVRGLSRQVASPGLFRKAKSLPIISTGPSTTKALHDEKFHHIHTCSIPSIEGVIEILKQFAR